MKTYFLSLLVFGMNALAFAQTSDSTTGKWKISDVTLQLGSSNSAIPNTNLSLSDFLIIAPSSTILKYAGLPDEYRRGMLFGPTPSFSMNMGISPGKNSGKLRVGFLYQGVASSASLFSFSDSSGAFDTLTSVATGETFLVDSTHEETYIVDVRSAYIGADVSMIYSTHYKRFNLFSGFGLNALCSLNSKTFVSHTIHTTYDQHYSNPWLQKNDVVAREQFDNKTTFKGIFYIPVGFDLTLSKKRPLLCNTSLHFEVRPSIQIEQLPNMRALTSVTNSTFFGLKYKL